VLKPVIGMMGAELKEKLHKLPLPFDLESTAVLKKLAHAHRALAELKGVTGLIPNRGILISTLSLQEAKDSSAIENIVTTHDELFQSDRASNHFTSVAAKEVSNYVAALHRGYEKVKAHGLITNSHILEIHAILVGNDAGFRALLGTDLKNEQTGQVVYTPPQEPEQVRELMNNLESYVNDDALSDADPLTKMAVIHHQFESIHPFYDGNGRTGRVINVLYLVKHKLLDTPVLYLSRYINQHKSEYYRLLQEVRDNPEAWEEWVLFILEGVIQTSQQAVELIHGMRELMQCYKEQIRQELPKIYSHELLNNLFRHPYTKIEFVTQELDVHRNTAGRYLDELVRIGLLAKHKIGTENFYVNSGLFDLLQAAGQS
jgi:cell filamentation protein, protein adenylyltransferase